MDISNFISLSAIFLPFIFSLFLFIKRMTLSYVNKKLLNSGLSVVCSISLLLFIVLSLSAEQTKISEEFSLFNLNKINLNFGYYIDSTNIKFLILSSLIFLLCSIFSKYYFKKKKQFIFTKQRYYTFFSLLIFNTYLLICSDNLFSVLIFCILQSVIVFIFSYFDIFKNNANFNITRFHRINIAGDFSFLLACLVLFKYFLLSKSDGVNLTMNIDNISPLIKYCSQTSGLDFQIVTGALLATIFSKLFVFPFNCYFSFFANSSNMLYLTLVGVLNFSGGVYLFDKFIFLANLNKEFFVIALIFAVVTLISSLIFLLFEKNFKIIFGYLFAALNSIFIIFYLCFRFDLTLYIYFALVLLFLSVLAYLFYIDKTSLDKRIINKKKGFILESAHIAVFETFPNLIYQIINIVDEKIIQNIFGFVVALFNFIISFIMVKTSRTGIFKCIRNILIFIAFFVIIAILCVLYRGI